ncbi:hypothetical protein SAMD00019534_006250 [Acytostelium subglobosum LB1]|uniref:hypothetical protein n=1 Tax=Acytostelium subglobosum LB1 TaxID=1410327 RepID=UPI000644EAB2|nr:hypothetical protein SAMD00019534_006250 [Acytostelium subglobosum LB1]GAM17450.1 hypothetical protein SAMD00019534_006250 [Acytostelium subglobosum LB1]|eukprot:XP_012759512.1 hypothetical protein SAMD00019534_006250 [Acytostelium subglobosum LB1]
MFKYLLLAALLCVAVTYAATIDGVVVVNVGNNAIRSYAVTSGLSTFTATGNSVYGSLTGGGLKAHSDSVSFVFNGNGACKYAFTHTNLDISGGSATGATGVSVTTGGSVNLGVFASVYSPFLIIEFEDTNGTPGFQQGDKILGWARLDKWLGGWDIQTKSAPYTTTANNQQYNFTVTQVTAISPDTVTTLRFGVTGAPITFNGTDLSSDITKIDVEIKNYYDANINKASPLCTVGAPYFECRSTGPSGNANSRLALASFVAVGSAELNVHAGAVVSKGVNGVSGVFDWVSTVTVNGTTATATVHADTYDLNKNNTYNVQFGIEGQSTVSAQLLVHSFDTVRPASIYWDPTFGGQAGNFGSVIVPSIGLILALVFALLL